MVTQMLAAYLEQRENPGPAARDAWAARVMPRDAQLRLLCRACRPRMFDVPVPDRYRARRVSNQGLLRQDGATRPAAILSDTLNR